MKISYLANLLEDVNLQLCNPNGETICIINDYSDASLQLTFNSIHELILSIPKTKNGKDIKYYDWLLMQRIIKIDNIGQFVIQDITIDSLNGEEVKHITAQSLECVLSWKNIPLLKSTYKFYSNNIDEIPNTLIGRLKGYMPTWTFEEIDSDLYDIYRTFDRENISIYNLIVEDIQPVYECVFLFDTINKTIKIKKVSNLIPKTDVYFSNENLIKEMNCTLSKENFVTVLEVKGAGDLGINRVNPIGTNYIYDLDYYLSETSGMMSDDLKIAWINWKNDYNTYAITYGTKLTTLKTKKDELLVLNNELAELNDDLEIIKDSIDTKNQIGSSASSEVAQKRTKEIQISNKKIQISTKVNEIKAIETELDTINETINPIGNTIYFSNSQLDELDFLFKTGSCINDLFAISNSMTDKQKQEVAEDLIVFGKSKLGKVSKPMWTFNLNTINLLANKKYEYIYNQLELPCEVTIEKNEGELFNPILLGCRINLKNIQNIELTFSESMRATNDLVTIEDLLGNPAKTQMTVIKNMSKWIDYVDSGDKDKFINWIGNPLQADVQAITNTDNQTFLIDKRGALFRKILANSTDFDDKQLKIINNGIWMTDDNWVTAKLGVGEYTLLNGNKVTGVIGDYIVGNIMMSNNLYITNSSGTTTIDKDGINVTAMTMTLTNTAGTNRILLNSTDVIKIQKKVNNVWVDNLSIDNNGNLKLSILDGYSTTAEMNSAISVSANSLTSTFTQQINTVDGKVATNTQNISTLTQTVSGIGTRVSTAEGNISTLNQTATSLQSQITSTNDNVSTLTQTANNFSIAINNTKVTIDNVNGVTIKNGGFKIKNNYDINVFEVDSSGNMTLAGNLYNTSYNKTVRLYNGKLEIGSGNSAGGNNSWFQNIVGSIYGEYYRLAPLSSEESLIIHANKSLYMRSTYYSSVGWGMGSAGHVFDGRVQLNNDIYINTSRGMRSFKPTRLTDTPSGDFVLSATW